MDEALSASGRAGESAGPLFNHSIAKGLAVLRAFNAQRRMMSLAEIAAAAGISKSSAQRMVFTFERLGYIRKHGPTRRFRLTPRVMEIGLAYLSADALIDVAIPFLSELTTITAETSNLTEPDGVEMVYVARFVSARFVPVHMPIGSRIPMYCTASGRAYLSALPEDEARALVERSPRLAHTVHTRTGVDEVLAALRQARRRGFASNCEELFLGDMTLAAPIVDGRGRPLASVHVVAPTSRWTLADAERHLAPPLLQCARSLSSGSRSVG